jgi:hypothetical protein
VAVLSLRCRSCKATDNFINMSDPSPDDREKFFTVAELGRRWRCHAETVRRQIRCGKLKSICPAGKHLVPESAVANAESKAIALWAR